MAGDTEPSREPSLAELVSGLIGDARDLIVQELALARHELENELRKAKTALISLGAGIAVMAIGGALLVLMVVHLVEFAAGLPSWAAYGIVGGTCVLVGVVMVLIGRRRVASTHVLPTEALQSVKENVEWIRRNTTSDKTSSRPAPH